MNATVAQLLNLQQLDLAIRTLGHQLQQIPKKHKAIDEKIKSVKEPLDAARAEIETLQKRAEEIKAKLASIEERERQQKLKIPQVKSNDEYSALLKEMDSLKKEKENSENQALADMEKLDALNSQLPALEEAYSKGEDSVKGERAALEDEKSSLEANLLKAKKERKDLESQVHAGWFRRYNTVAAQRNGLVVAGVQGGICQGCFIGVRPKLVQDLHYDEEVIVCEGCSRILYLSEP